MTPRITPQQLATDPAALIRFANLEWQELSHYERLELVRGVAELGPPANVQVLGGLLEHLEDPVFQAQILSALDLSGLGGSVPAFFERMLASPDNRVRANAIEALGQARDERLRCLVKPLLSDPDNRVRANACVHLWRYPEERSRVQSALEEMALMDDPWSRTSAIFACARLKDPAFDPLLYRSLEDSYEPAVLQALRALTQRGAPGVGPYLKNLLADQTRGTSLQQAAAEAALALPVLDPALLGDLLRAVGSIGERELQDRCLRELGRCKAPELPDRLLELLERLQSDQYHLCQRLLELMGKLGKPEHRARLTRLSKGPLGLYADIIEQAIRSIGRRRSWWGS
jgi:HEAT repeat protein